MGQLPRSALLETQSQVASEQLQLVRAKNQRDIALLGIKQLLEIESNTNFDIVVPLIELPKQKSGDFLAICDVGAYGFVMASNYNTICLPPEILINEKQIGKILIYKKYPFGLIKFNDESFNFDKKLNCGSASIKTLRPVWLK